MAVPVHRDDRGGLLAIRDGLWSYDELLAQSEALSVRISGAKAASLARAYRSAAGIPAIARSARAVIVKEGFTPGFALTADPSIT